MPDPFQGRPFGPLHDERGAQGAGDPADVVGIAGDDLVPTFDRVEHDRSIHDVTCAGLAQRVTDGACIAFAEFDDLDLCQQAGQAWLGSAPPDLCQNDCQHGWLPAEPPETSMLVPHPVIVRLGG